MLLPISSPHPPVLIINIVHKTEVPKSLDYIIQPGDSLTTIAEAHSTSVMRLWAANTQLDSPDILKPGDPLKVPQNTDVLPTREMPVSIVSTYTVSQGQTSPPSGGFSSSNPYEYGWCVWYAANQRPDLHIMDNASGWIRYSNGTTPKVGAVAVNTWAVGGLGHVGIVRDFNDKQVLVESMNFKAFGIVTTDWVDRSYFSGYIY